MHYVVYMYLLFIIPAAVVVEDKLPVGEVGMLVGEGIQD